MARAKKGATSKGKGGGRSPAPSWLWMVTGLAVGFFVAFLVFLGTHGKPTPSNQTTVKESPKPKEKPAEKVEAPKPAEHPANTNTGPQQTAKVEPPKQPDKKPMNYDFYKKLPKFEVEVPEAKNGAHPKPVSDPGSYILQAGSFKSAGEADARKAQLALLGIVSTVQVVSAEGKPAFYRVRTKPYRDLDKLNQARQTLRENKIDFMTLKESS